MTIPMKFPSFVPSRQLPVETAEIKRKLAEAALVVNNYTAIFQLKDNRVCSGVYVNTCGYEGILTAYHCADAVLKSGEFSLVIKTHAHVIWLNAEHFEHVPIGYNKGNPNLENGPDLSFFIIRDPKLLEILRSVKSFCYLENVDTGIFALPLDAVDWVIAGSPFEKVTEESKPNEIITYVDSAIYQVTRFVSHTERDGFDYIDLTLPCGVRDFPESFEGMSGGGIWFEPFGVNSATDFFVAPVLAGISFHQSPKKDNERIITGHGFDSLYRRLRQTLKEW